jgi:DNA-binding Lrp family transcriptional regulator
MAKKARKYGEAWKDVQIDANQFDRVYDKLIRSPSLPTVDTEQPVADKHTDEPTATMAEAVEALPLNDRVSFNDTASLADRVSHKKRGTLSVNDSLPYRADTVSQNDTLSQNDIALPDFSLLRALPSGGGYFPSFNVLEDFLMPQLDPTEQAIYRRLIRLSWGHRRNTCTVGYLKLAEKTGLKRTAAREATQRLEQKGLIKKLAMQLDPSAGEQGNIYLVFVPEQMREYWSKEKKTRPRNDTLSFNDTLSPNVPMKEHDVFVSKNTDTQTKTSMRVGSHFSLEECRRFAGHLKSTGQGITNPGGYATKIFRSGEADTLIEAFLNQAQPVDINECPDCRGQGFYYPNGVGNGPVAKCRHDKLKARES